MQSARPENKRLRSCGVHPGARSAPAVAAFDPALNQHLSSAHPFGENARITTMTVETLLKPLSRKDVVTPSMLLAARDQLARETRVTPGFKNAIQMTVLLDSRRSGGGCRRVNTKVFKNLRLHITGADSIDMALSAAEFVRARLSELLATRLVEDALHRRVDAVLYKFRLPGEVHMDRLQSLLLRKGMLAMYDPSTFAGIRAKIPLAENEKLASVMFFRLGKVVIILPRQTSFDTALRTTLKTIEDVVYDDWESVRLLPCGGLPPPRTPASQPPGPPGADAHDEAQSSPLC